MCAIASHPYRGEARLTEHTCITHPLMSYTNSCACFLTTEECLSGMYVSIVVDGIADMLVRCSIPSIYICVCEMFVLLVRKRCMLCGGMVQCVVVIR